MSNHEYGTNKDWHRSSGRCWNGIEIHYKLNQWMNILNIYYKIKYIDYNVNNLCEYCHVEIIDNKKRLISFGWRPENYLERYTDFFPFYNFLCPPASTYICNAELDIPTINTKTSINKSHFQYSDLYWIHFARSNSISIIYPPIWVFVQSVI